jgi:hypothetical protein
VRWLESEYLPEVVDWVGGIDVHCPNGELFKDEVVLVDTEGKSWRAPQFPEVLSKFRKLPGDAQLSFDLYRPFFEIAPKPFPLPVSLIYNSGRERPRPGWAWTRAALATAVREIWDLLPKGSMEPGGASLRSRRGSGSWSEADSKAAEEARVRPAL